MTELEAARRIVAAADHYLASVREHGHKSATAEQALDCYTTAIEQDADVVARALLAREQAVAGWQPIETAPRDGTFCLFFGPRTRGGGTYIDIGNWHLGRWTVAWMDDQDEPTHWQPLPAPPALPAKEPT